MQLRQGGMDEFGHEKFTGVAAQLAAEVEKRIERTRALRVPGEGFKRVMSERPEMRERKQLVVFAARTQLAGGPAQGFGCATRDAA